MIRPRIPMNSSAGAAIGSLGSAQIGASKGLDFMATSAKRLKIINLSLSTPVSV